jgi:hypothetical protein
MLEKRVLTGGVDTHSEVHVAVVIDLYRQRGVLLWTTSNTRSTGSRPAAGMPLPALIEADLSAPAVVARAG